MTDDKLMQLIDAAREAAVLPLRKSVELSGNAKIVTLELEWLRHLVLLVQAEEREACARIAQQTVCASHAGSGIRIYGAPAAKSIRARGEVSE